MLTSRCFATRMNFQKSGPGCKVLGHFMEHKMEKADTSEDGLQWMVLSQYSFSFSTIYIT